MAVIINPWPLFIAPAMGGFGIGAGFEYAFHPFFSIKPYTQIWYLNPRDWNEEVTASLFMFRFSTEARWYPLGNFVNGLFTNLGLQYHHINASANFFENAASGSFNTLSIFWGVGNKFIWGRGRAAFLFEPALGWAWDLATSMPSLGPGDYFLGSLLGIRGFRYSLNLGVAF